MSTRCAVMHVRRVHRRTNVQALGRLGWVTGYRYPCWGQEAKKYGVPRTHLRKQYKQKVSGTQPKRCVILEQAKVDKGNVTRGKKKGNQRNPGHRRIVADNSGKTEKKTVTDELSFKRSSVRDEKNR